MWVGYCDATLSSTKFVMEPFNIWRCEIWRCEMLLKWTNILQERNICELEHSRKNDAGTIHNRDRSFR